MVVADSSALIEYLVGADLGPWVEEQFEEEPELHAPHVVDVEVLGVMRRLAAARRLSACGAERALALLVELRLVRHGHVPLLGRMWELRANVAPRDAAFIALAELIGATLVTTDRRLARAPGIRAHVVTP